MRADIIIIGSGVAATAVLSKLLQKNPKASIIMVEAGKKIKTRDFAYFQNYLVSNKLPGDSKIIYDSCYDLPYPARDVPGENVNAGKTLIPLDGSRVIAYGGSTMHWGGWSFRMKPEDFHLNKNTGTGIDWPFDYNYLEPWYCEAERFIGVAGDSNDGVTPRSQPYPYMEFPYTLEDSVLIDSFKAQGITYSHLPIARHGISDVVSEHAPCQTTGTCKYCPFGARFVAANDLDLLLRNGHYPNFQLLQPAVANTIIMSSKTQAAGVMISEPGKKEDTFIEAGIVILASGAIEAPKILMRSVSTFWMKGIGNDHDLVGRNLITHPYFFFEANLSENPKMLQPEMGFPTLVSRHFDSEAEQAKGKFILLNPPSSPIANIATFMKQGMSPAGIQTAVKGPSKVQLQGIIEVFSAHNNRIMPYDKTNRLGLQQTIVDFTQDAGFDERMAYVKSVADRIFASMNATGNTMLNTSWRADHAACTTRMSATPDVGVVDSNLKIHGVDNIYICSNSSFASLGSVNPTLTLTALSLRLGNHLNSVITSQQ
jgi:choline dehydrogenase-like flavoprotein